MQVCWHDIKYAPQHDHDLHLKAQKIPLYHLIR